MINNIYFLFVKLARLLQLLLFNYLIMIRMKFPYGFLLLMMCLCCRSLFELN